MQQPSARFGAREVSATLPEWLMGSYQPTEGIDIRLNGLFRDGLTVFVTLACSGSCSNHAGSAVRATTQNRIMAAGRINTGKVDRGLRIGCASPHRGSRSHHPSTVRHRTLYIVDTFLVVVFGGAASLFGTIASAFSIASAVVMEFF